MLRFGLALLVTAAPAVPAGGEQGGAPAPAQWPAGEAECFAPPWHDAAGIPSSEADQQLADSVAELIAEGQADAVVSRLRAALSPTVLEDADRYWAAPHAALRGALGRALLKASPAVCPDHAACRGAALAQFVAAEKRRRGGDPLHSFVPDDALETRINEKPWENVSPDPTVGVLAQRLLGWTGLVSSAPGREPEGHLKGMFELPGKQGEVLTFAESESPPAVREFFHCYAPGGAAGFLQPECAEAVSRVCPKPLPDCGWKCMERCAHDSLEQISASCVKRGEGKPFVLKGYSKHWPASALRDNPKRLVKDYGTADKNGKGPPSIVEYERGKKESRIGTAGEMPLSQYIDRYEDEDWYNVGFPPGSMLDDVALAPFLSCGGYTDSLTSALVWMSSGGTKSVVHYDDADNLNCLISGSKRMIFWPPSYRDKIESDALGWVNHDGAEGEFQTYLLRYGRYAGGLNIDADSIDTDAVDLLKYPGWGELEWWEANMEAGDCLFIPSGWYHHVDSPRPPSGEPQLNLGLNVWWQRTDELDEASIDDSGLDGCPALNAPVVLSSCEFTEQDVNDVDVPTRCRPCYAGAFYIKMKILQ